MAKVHLFGDDSAAGVGELTPMPGNIVCVADGFSTLTGLGDAIRAVILEYERPAIAIGCDHPAGEIVSEVVISAHGIVALQKEVKVIVNIARCLSLLIGSRENISYAVVGECSCVRVRVGVRLLNDPIHPVVGVLRRMDIGVDDLNNIPSLVIFVTCLVAQSISRNKPPINLVVRVRSPITFTIFDLE